MMSHVARDALGASRASLRVSSDHETWMMAECESVVASFVAQVRGVKFTAPLYIHSRM